MAIDFAGDLEDIFDAGDLPEVTGTLVQDATSYAFTRGMLVKAERLPGRGNKDRLERALMLEATGIGATPRADAVVTLTGETDPWRVMSADPIAPGGAVIAWRLRLETFVVRDAS